jgi:hypothetical protein
MALDLGTVQIADGFLLTSHTVPLEETALTPFVGTLLRIATYVRLN